MKEFIRYVTLSILGQLGISCYIIADTFFISKGLGANGLTALNLAIPIYNFIFGCGLMFGVGGATRFSILGNETRCRNRYGIFQYSGFDSGDFNGICLTWAVWC